MGVSRATHAFKCDNSNCNRQHTVWAADRLPWDGPGEDLGLGMSPSLVPDGWIAVIEGNDDYSAECDIYVFCTVTCLFSNGGLAGLMMENAHSSEP